MQVIAAVVRGQQTVRIARVAHRCVEIDDCVERPAAPNPLVDGLTRRFPSRIVEEPSLVGRYRAADRAQTARVRLLDDLLQSELDLRSIVLMRRLLNVV